MASLSFGTHARADWQSHENGSTHCKDVINAARANNSKVHIAPLLNLCHQKTRSIGRDNVKYDTGGYAVLTEQGASASHITSAKVLDTSSRLPVMSGEANDAVSAYNQVKMCDSPASSRTLHPILRKLAETECPTVWIRPPWNATYMAIHWQGCSRKED